MVVVLLPALKLLPCVGQGEEDLHVQAFVPQLAVEAFDLTVLDRSSRPDAVQVDAVGIGPEIRGLTSCWWLVAGVVMRGGTE